MLLPQDPQIYAFTRRLEDVELLVMANFSHETAAADLPGAAALRLRKMLGSLKEGQEVSPG